MAHLIIPRTYMGLETEHSIYVGSEDLTTSLRQNLTGKVTEQMMAAVTTNTSVMGLQPAMRKLYPINRNEFLRNGARFYKDICIPEYSTPECPTPRELVAHDKAGERILMQAAQTVSQRLGERVRLYKKNSDGQGHSRGCHENYGIARYLFKRMTSGSCSGATPRIFGTFMAVRTLLTGAGKVGVERNDEDSTPFQMSQRADFMVKFRSTDTRINRPIIETRDEGHCDEDVLARLHVICGDANLCQWSVYLKTGLTSLLLMMLEDRFIYDRLVPVFTNSNVGFMKLISRDLAFQYVYPVTMIKGDAEGAITGMSAVDILRVYLDTMEDYLSHRVWEDPVDGEVYQDVVTKARFALDRVSTTRWPELEGYLDWATKRAIMNRYLANRGKSWEDVLDPANQLRSSLRALEIAYTFLDDEGLYFRMLRRGAIHRIVKDSAIVQAMSTPPKRSRAAHRTALVERYGPALVHVDWSEVIFAAGTFAVKVKLAWPWGAHEALFAQGLKENNKVMGLRDMLEHQPIPGLSIKVD